MVILSLRLLARVFGETPQSLEQLLATAEAQLVQAHDTYLGPEHRHYKLYACIEVSVRSLEPGLRAVLGALWVFHTPFLAQSAVAVLDPETVETEQHQSVVRTALHQLWKRSLLTSQTISTRDGDLHFYALLPTTRPYLEAHLKQAYERSTLLSRLGQAYFALTRWIYDELDRGAAANVLTQYLRVDLDRGWQYLEKEDGARYLRLWGWVLYRLGSASQGLERLELALEHAQEEGRPFFASVVSTLALVYHGIGHPTRALELYEQALPILRDVGDRAGEATTLNNLAGVYHRIGHPTRALELYEQALPILRDVGDRAGEATTLNGLAFLYQEMQRYREARDAFDASIRLEQEVSHLPGEIASLVGRAYLLYQHLSLPEDALLSLEKTQELFRSTGLSHDAAGNTLADVEGLQESIRQGRSQAPTASQPLLNEILQAIRAFLSTNDWPTARHVVEAQQESLFRPEVEQIFLQNIAQAQHAGEKRVAKLLEEHLALLLACQRDGIDSTFAPLLAQTEETDWPFDPELISKSVAALLGDPMEKFSYFQYLVTFVAQTTDA